ncbi:MAG: DUF1186 domain-containing protein [Terracidiphilus sp.]
MEIEEIIEQLEWFSGDFEKEAVEAAIARRDEIIPELLLVLEEIADPKTAAELEAEGDYMAHLYAMFLLAQFREVRAYPLMVRIAFLPGELLDSLFGDSLTEDYGRFLASVCGGDLEGFQSIIENPAANQWIRGAALDGLVTLVATGVKSREDILCYFAELFHGKLIDKNDLIWSDLVCSAMDLCAAELLGEIEKAFEQELVDESVIDLDGVRRDLVRGKDWAMDKLARDPRRHLIDDTVKEMAGWASFDKEEQRKEKARMALNQRREDAPTGFKRVAPKIGRNDPCPCASGKKYKKCCGQ